MFSKTERLLAWRYLKSRKRTGFVSVIAGFSFLGILLGVATLIIVMSVMNGFKTELMTRVLGLNGHLGVYPAWGDVLTDYQKYDETMRSVAGVVDVIPVVDGQVMATAGEISDGVMVRGMEPADFQKRSLLFQNYKGLPFNEFSGNSVIVGYRLAQKMMLRPGDTITLVSPKGNITAFGTIPRMKAYTVIGTFDSGMFEYDGHFMFMPLEEAQRYFKTGTGVSHLEVFTEDVLLADAVLDEAFEKIDGTEAQLYDWRHTNQAFFNAIEVERNVMFLILTLIILVAAFNMISGLIMLVQDKNKDIAILRTMGMSRRGVRHVFLLAGLTIGFLGTMTGLILGLLFSYNIDQIKEFLQGLSGQELFSAEIYFLSHLPAKVDLTEVAVVVVLSLTLSVLATVYPSWKASKTDPVEALRYE